MRSDSRAQREQRALCGPLSVLPVWANYRLKSSVMTGR